MERPRSGTERTPCCRRAHRPQRADHTTSRIGHNTAPNRFSRLLRTADLSRNRRLIPRGTGSSNSAPSSGESCTNLTSVSSESAVTSTVHSSLKSKEQGQQVIGAPPLVLAQSGVKRFDNRFPLPQRFKIGSQIPFSHRQPFRQPGCSRRASNAGSGPCLQKIPQCLGKDFPQLLLRV